MRFIIFFLFLNSGIFVFSQTDKTRTQLVNKAFENYKAPEVEKRKFLSLKGKSIIAKVNPLTYVAGSLMFVYQRLLSEQIQANCNYHLSCSNYAKFSMEQKGLLRGLLMGVDQLTNCFPGIDGDYERCRIDHDGKIINNPSE